MKIFKTYDWDGRKKKIFDLWYPKGYALLTPKQKRKICNGCGSIWGGILIPDTIWGLDISEACNIHDYMYHVGKTLLEKEFADKIFRNNMKRLVLIGSANSFMVWLRNLRISLFYWGVKHFGEDAFFDKFKN